MSTPSSSVSANDLRALVSDGASATNSGTGDFTSMAYHDTFDLSGVAAEPPALPIATSISAVTPEPHHHHSHASNTSVPSSPQTIQTHTTSTSHHLARAASLPPTALPTAAAASSSSSSSSSSSNEDKKKRQAALAAASRAHEKRQVDAKQMRMLKTRMYQKLFSLPQTEQLIEDYSCAIRKSILLHGRIYISWNQICFFSSIFSHKTILNINCNDVLACSAASVVLLFDNAIRIHVQNGPLPIPKINSQGNIVPLPGAPIVQVTPTPTAIVAPAPMQASEAASSSSALTPNGSEVVATSDPTHISPNTSPSLNPHTSPAEVTEVAPLSAAELLATVAPVPSATSFTTTAVVPTPSTFVDPTSNAYTDVIATTTNASIELNAQQIQYLIAINHPNITTHFFASFLMRDHCLTLIEGLLKKRRESNPAWVAMQAAWKQAEENRNAAAAAAAAAAFALQQQQKKEAELFTPPMSPLGGQNPPQSPVTDSEDAQSTGPENVKDAAASSTSNTAHSPSSSSMPRNASSNRVSEMKEDLLAVPPSRTVFTSSTSSSSSLASAAAVPSVPLPAFHLSPRLEFGDAVPPADDFTANEPWDDIVDTVLPAITSRMFFELFLSDLAILTTKQYALASGKGDTEWKLSSWFDPKSGLPVINNAQVNKNGPWIRDSSYLKVMTGSPLGPPVTRVHQQALFTATDTQCKLETRNVTPDVPFGDCLYVLERLIVTDQPNGGGCRIRVSVGVRFIKQPWKMRMFVSLIRSKTKEDVQQWYLNWIKCIQDYMKRHASQVQAALQRAMGVVVALPLPAEESPGSTPSVPQIPSSPLLESKQDVEAPFDLNSSSPVLSPSISPVPFTSLAPTTSASRHPTPATVPLVEWPWLRPFLASIPYVSDQTPVITSGVASAREFLRDYEPSELLFGVLMLLATLSFIMQSEQSFFTMFLNLILPWRWLGVIFSSPSAILLAACLLYLSASLRRDRATHQLITQLRDSHARQDLHTQRMQHQLEELKHIMLKKSRNVIHESHFD